MSEVSNTSIEQSSTSIEQMNNAMYNAAAHLYEASLHMRTVPEFEPEANKLLEMAHGLAAMIQAPQEKITEEKVDEVLSEIMEHLE